MNEELVRKAEAWLKDYGINQIGDGIAITENENEEIMCVFHSDLSERDTVVFVNQAHLERCAEWLEFKDSIPRPRKQEVEQVEWSGAGFPPVGVECLFDCTARGKVCGNAQGVVKYMSEYTCVMDIGGSEFVAHPDTMKFRPLKTEAEKEREKLHSLLMKIFEANKAFKAEVVADSIIEAGWRPNDKSL